MLSISTIPNIVVVRQFESLKAIDISRYLARIIFRIVI